MAIPAIAVAQEERDDGSGPCGTINTTSCESGYHKLQGPGGTGHTGVHGECLYCSTGVPEDCHLECPGEENEEATVRIAYRAILDAARRGDAQAILRLAPQAARFVNVNIERGALQIRSCSGKQIVASLRVFDSDRLRTLATTLALAKEAALVGVASLLE